MVLWLQFKGGVTARTTKENVGMVKFEVGKVYRTSDGRTYMKVLRRTDSRVYTTFVTKEGKFYSLDYKFRNIKTGSWCDCEFVEFPIGFLGQVFYANDAVENFDEVIANHAAEESAREKAFQHKVKVQAKDLAEFLKAKGLTIAQAYEICDKMADTCSEARAAVERGEVE